MSTAPPSYRYRCWFSDDKSPPRDVTARDPDGARRCALWAEKLVNPKARRLRVTHVEKLWAVGSYHTHTDPFDAARQSAEAQDITGGTHEQA